MSALVAALAVPPHYALRPALMRTLSIISWLDRVLHVALEACAVFVSPERAHMSQCCLRRSSTALCTHPSDKDSVTAPRGAVVPNKYLYLECLMAERG